MKIAAIKSIYKNRDVKGRLLYTIISISVYCLLLIALPKLFTSYQLPIILLAGGLFVVWLSGIITRKGIGNGLLLIVLISIITNILSTGNIITDLILDLVLFSFIVISITLFASTSKRN